MRSVQLLLLLLAAPHAAGYASSLGCSRSLRVGATIMSRTVGSSGRSVAWKRGGATISCGATYVPGEILTLTLSSGSGQYVTEVSGGASISGGQCGGKRHRNTRTVTVTMPSSGTVKGWAGPQACELTV